MSEKKEVEETLKAAHLYLNKLKAIHQQVQNAEQQVSSTSQETIINIQATFNNLKSNLNKILDERCAKLIQQVHKTRKQCIAPLEECKVDVTTKVQTTSKLINKGECILKGNEVDLTKFSQDSSLLGSLPEIPELKEVPYLTFQYEHNIESEMLRMCSHIGEVSRIAPVQISQMYEKPGSILVEWQIIQNDERMTDIQEFRLQKAFGDVLKEKHLNVNFSDCYVGLETQFLVKDLKATQSYSFRVCCKFEGTNDWSPWSVVQVFSTSLKPFSWQPNSDYSLSNEDKIAYPIAESPCILLSDSIQFSEGCSAEFTFLEFDGGASAIGLILGNNVVKVTDIKSSTHSYFILNSNGEIHVDGSKKSTKLPETIKGLKVCFTCEPVSDEKIRVNIDSCDKRVTYDWHISMNHQLYFAAQLSSKKSKIMIE